MKMKKLPKPKIKSLLTKLYWDTNVKPDDLYRLLKGEIDKIGHIDRFNLYYRVLTTFDWYTILKMIPPEDLTSLLSDNVLGRIHPKDLKNKYRYAREILSG
jgi:hypothetical protein